MSHIVSKCADRLWIKMKAKTTFIDKRNRKGGQIIARLGKNIVGKKVTHSAMQKYYYPQHIDGSYWISFCKGTYRKERKDGVRLIRILKENNQQAAIFVRSAYTHVKANKTLCLKHRYRTNAHAQLFLEKSSLNLLYLVVLCYISKAHKTFFN